MNKRRSLAEERARGSHRGPGPLRRIVNNWWERLFGAVSERSLSGQEELYDDHQTSKDYVWNTIGLAAWGVMFPVFTVVITQILGTEQAGMFSLAFVTGNVARHIGYYGVRTYQVSDIDERHSFFDYRIARWITCAALLLIAYLYCAVRGFEGELFAVMMGVFAFRCVDALADVYEGRLQQKDKLYLAGVSQLVHSAVPFAVFLVLLVVTRSLAVASIGMATGAVAAFLLVTLPLTLFETRGSYDASFKSVAGILRQCFPLFLAVFLYALIDNMPKFAMDGVLDYSAQLYFNAMYFPAQFILLAGGLVYKPLIVRMANAWADEDARGSFDRLIIGMFAVIFGITVAALLLFQWAGVPFMSFLYGVDFEDMRTMCLLMLVAGGITGGIDFLYQVTTIIRNQGAITRIYLLTFAIALVVPFVLIHALGLFGAVASYLVVMGVLFSLMLAEYVRVRTGRTRTRRGSHFAGNDPTSLRYRLRAIQNYRQR